MAQLISRLGIKWYKDPYSAGELTPDDTLNRITRTAFIAEWPQLPDVTLWIDEIMPKDFETASGKWYEADSYQWGIEEETSDYPSCHGVTATLAEAISAIDAYIASHS